MLADLCKKFPKLVLVNFTADPEIGRFISQDSYRGELNDPGQWYLYAYCANNPINYVDPSGHARYKKNYKFFASDFKFWFKPKMSSKIYMRFTAVIWWKVKNYKIIKGSIQVFMYCTYLTSMTGSAWRHKSWHNNIGVGSNRKKATITSWITVENLYTEIKRTSKVICTIDSKGNDLWNGPIIITK